MSGRFTVTFHVRGDAAGIEARARGIAVEQSVEMPLEAIDDPWVLSDIVGTVEGIDDLGHGVFAVRIGLATDTIGGDGGQFLNMVFGNTSLHADVTLHDIDLPPALLEAFGGPAHGIEALRHRLRLQHRPLTASALKPQGLSPARLGQLAEQFARGGLDLIKDDHGLADQEYSRFADRLRACAEGVRRAVRMTGHPTRYVPSLSGHLDSMRGQARLAREEGLDCLLLAPMICGFATFQAMRREFPEMAFLAHPSLAGAARIAPDLLIGKLFRVMGADAVIFPHFGGRFGYTRETCWRLADNARLPVHALRPVDAPVWVAPGDTSDDTSHDTSDDGSPRAHPVLRPALPVPAGGMTLDRTREILDFYGADTMLLIGGNLLMARENITLEAERFARAVGDWSLG
jgi:ribulose-bisphosphate carboxylase large chain